MDDKEKQTKELLEVLKKALESEAGGTDHNNHKAKQETQAALKLGGGKFPPTAFIISTAT